MATLKEVAELAYNQISPKPGDETAIEKEEVIATARYLYATQMWVQARNEKNTEGEYNVPSYLLSEVEKDVVNNEMDLSDLKILRGLPGDIWLQNVGGLTCDCEYVKSTVNTSQLFKCNDTFEGLRTFIPFQDKIKFPNGVHANPLSIIYANVGENVNGDIIIDDVVAGILRDKLIDTYNPQKIGKEDITNNTSSDN